MEKEKISVIIPVYNTEKYIEKCVTSVQAQTYENLEILLVDDGSVDGSLARCQAMAQQDSRITVLHRENGGASAARNTGLDAATGDYIAFVDSDDYIAPNTYERLHQALVEADADMSLCDFAYVDETGQKILDIPPMKTAVIGRRQAFELVEFGQEEWRYISLVNRLYKRRLFDHYRLKEGQMCEDEYSAHSLYGQCETIAVIQDVLYWDVKRDNSVMTSPVSIRRLAGTDSRLERYEYFLQCGYKKLARSSLRRAYASLWLVMKHVNVWVYREEIAPRVRCVVRQQLRQGDILRAVLVCLLYARGWLTGRSKEI
jgi:glycosyltransferase involved in cell wall biosynthesis